MPINSTNPEVVEKIKQFNRMKKKSNELNSISECDCYQMNLIDRFDLVQLKEN